MKEETTKKTAEAKVTEEKKDLKTEVKATAAKAGEKAAEVKAAAEKAVKAVPEKVAGAAKEAAAKVEKAVKAPKAAEKKAEKAEKPAKEKKAAKPAKKAADPKSTVYVEFQGAQIKAKDILKLAEKDFKKKNRGVVIKTLEIYIKPEENVAYYVANGEGSQDYCVFL